MSVKKSLATLLAVCVAVSALSVPALAAGSVVWSRDTVLADGRDYADATISKGVRVEIQTGLLITGTLTVEEGGSLVGKGLFYPAVGSTVTGMTLYYGVAGEYKPFKDGLKTLWDANLWPGYAPHFEYDSAKGLWYLYGENGDFEVDPFYPTEGGGGGGRDLNPAMDSANRLKLLGLFQGVGTNPDGGTDFDLERPATRVEALVMLIRLLGKEKAAEAGGWEHPFTDVPSWADNYVGYAYENGLTKGSSATVFGLGDASSQMFLTFVLRALGYSDAQGGDFVWSAPEKLAAEVGLLKDAGISLDKFLRADASLVSEAALSARLKDSSLLLRDKLIADGAFTLEQYNAAISAW